MVNLVVLLSGNITIDILSSLFISVSVDIFHFISLDLFGRQQSRIKGERSRIICFEIQVRIRQSGALCHLTRRLPQASCVTTGYSGDLTPNVDG